MKFTIIVLAVLLSVSSVNAQTFSLGGKAGANMTKVTGQNFKDGFELGYHLGVWAELQGKKWGVQPEVLFNQVNTTAAYNANDVVNNWQQNTKDIQLNYLTIPLLLRYNVADAFSLNLGPQYGILLNKDETLWNNGKSAFKSGDFSVVGGATINLKKLRVYARYVVGLTDIKDVSNTDSWKSQQAQFGVGYKLF